MDSLSWLIDTGHHEQVQSNAPASTNLVTDENMQRLAGIPILFLTGSKNRVFAPENTDKSYTLLCHAHGRELYQREVFTGRGHLDMWMGPTAYIDVYPRVLQHVELSTRGC